MRSRGLLLPFGQDLEEKFRASTIEFNSVQLIHEEKVNSSAVGDDSGEGVLMHFDEFVHELGRRGAFHTKPFLRCGTTWSEEQVEFADITVFDPKRRLAFADPVTGREGIDRRLVDYRVRFVSINDIISLFIERVTGSL